MSNNVPWNLEAFVDAMVVELDKTRETLAIKAINKPLSYSVKDMSMNLNIFPSFDGDTVKFVTAQPGQEGASTLNVQLSSITDRQVRETSKRPAAQDDIALDEIDIDKDVKKQLRKIGVTSVSELDEIQKKNVDLKKVAPGGVDYNRLANLIKKSRRDNSPPQVRSASLHPRDDGGYNVHIEGDRLAVDPSFQTVGVINKSPVDVVKKSSKEVVLSCPQSRVNGEAEEVILVLDPFSVLRFTLNPK
jgi:hypothetical protein